MSYTHTSILQVFPPTIFTAFGIYASLFAILYLSKSAYKVAATKSTVTVTHPGIAI